MANVAARIAGPMLRAKPKATADEVLSALQRAWTPTIVATEWHNEALRRNGVSGSEERRGREYRAGVAASKAMAEIHRGFARLHATSAEAMPSNPFKPKTPSRLQRIARRIARLFRKH